VFFIFYFILFYFILFFIYLFIFVVQGQPEHKAGKKKGTGRRNKGKKDGKRTDDEVTTAVTLNAKHRLSLCVAEDALLQIPATHWMCSTESIKANFICTYSKSPVPNFQGPLLSFLLSYFISYSFLSPPVSLAVRYPPVSQSLASSRCCQPIRTLP